MFLLTIALGVINMILRGYVIQKLWGWFIITQFAGLPTLSLVACLGLSLVATSLSAYPSLTTVQRTESSTESSKTILFNSFVHILISLMLLMWGAILHAL